MKILLSYAYEKGIIAYICKVIAIESTKIFCEVQKRNMYLIFHWQTYIPFQYDNHLTC